MRPSRNMLSSDRLDQVVYLKCDSALLAKKRDCLNML